jgi:pectin methylesterase-like acyl-CoA thioesterase
MGCAGNDGSPSGESGAATTSTGRSTGVGTSTGPGGSAGGGGSSGLTGSASTGGGSSAGSTGSSSSASGGADAGRSEAGAGDGGSKVDASTGPDSGTTGSGPLPGGLSGFPAPGAQGVCPDPPLRITFSGAPTLGTSGKIQVFDAAQPATAVAVVDMGATAFSDTIGGTTFNLVRPAYVDGSSAVIYLKQHALTYGHTYYVTVDSGAVTGPNGAAVSITGANTWRFTVAAAAPASGANLTVALDDSAPFCSVQGAIDAIPANNSRAISVTIAAGAYHEVVHFTSKNNVTLIGRDRKATIIEGTNNANLNASTQTRSLVGIDRSTGLVIDTLTIHNLTPQGGSQAEALRLQSCDQCVVRNADVLSLQDTLLWDGRIYAKNCLIAGNVDFVWGGGAAYFDQCEIRTVTRSGWDVQARNPATTYGYVFVDSKLTADSGITGQGLARIDASVYPASHVAYINCQVGSHISPAGWTITGTTDFSQLRFWEYQSVDPSGNPINVSQRAAGSTQITAAQAAMMRDPTVVLAGWQPPTQ